MTRQLEQEQENKQTKFNKDVAAAINGGLEGAVSRAGGVLLGFSFRYSDVDCLLTLRAEFPGGRVVGFVGGDSLAGCLRKAMKTARRDEVRWRADRWAGGES